MKSVFIGLFLAILLLGCGTAGQDDTTKLTESKYERARLLDFSKTNDYDLITGSKKSAALRSLTSNTTSADGSSSAWKMIASMVAQKVKAKRYSKRTVIDNGDSVIYEDREYADISGYVDMRFAVNKKDGSFRGSMEYVDFKNSENGLCNNNPISIDGKLSISGIYDIYNDYMQTMTMKVYDETIINDIVFKENFSVRINYTNEESATLILNGDINQYGKEYGFKDYQIFTYIGEDYRYNYSYPISGNLYIFSPEVEGYFYVDKSYPHASTPTKTDICQEHFYAGKERYIGDNSTLVFEIDEPDHYKISIDYGNDSTIDKTIQGNL